MNVKITLEISAFKKITNYNWLNINSGRIKFVTQQVSLYLGDFFWVLL